MTLFIRHVFVVLVPYQCNTINGFTLKIQMISPLLHSHWPCGAGVPRAHHMLVAWQRQDGFCLQKHAYICSFSYNFSCHVAEDIRDTTCGTDCLQLHAQQRTWSYNKKIWIWCLISVSQISSYPCYCAPPAGTMREQETNTDTTHCAGLRWPLGPESICCLKVNLKPSRNWRGVKKISYL